ncbi:Gar1/Naf1 RNA binding region-domain-containing protein [Aspergillus coremiiformis]|uniref:H/ACA ribonucleoprotein complex non-core subunit NAF1 n=1 Tax=Aspergillus coremiiformis TaxID=138285 RepID=A0A5N6ZCV5_9EURO|nr:Gar1/Naf1 RNA binding region-domain-containing protein [Aspergillus coremiiformis]
MTDQQPPVQPQHSLEEANEGPPVKRTCMNDTPPIALTPADDESDFYNTPWFARTPVENGENVESATQGQTTETAATSHPSTLIPGLNLVNDSLKDLQPEKSEPSPSPNNTTREGVHTDAQNDMDVTAIESENQDPTLESAKKVEAEQITERRIQAEATNQDQVENVQSNGSVNGTSNAPTADAMEHDQAEQDEDEEHPEWEIDSSPYESSSDDSSTDSSDDSDEDEDDYPILSPEEQARILMQADLGSDDEGEGKGKSGGHIRTANELPDEVPQIPDVTVTPEMKIVLLGHIEAMVENNVLIMANTSGEYQVLESGSLLCFEDRSIAGVVAETLGRVENPMYTIRYPSAAAVEERGLSKGKNLYYVEQHSTFVFTQPLKGVKGSDASNFHDEEIAEDEVEFSDDEAEAEYKRKVKQKRQERKDARNEGGSARSKRGPPGPSKLGQSELNYDDNTGEDGYTPLSRPKNLHEMMNRQEAPVENDGPPARGGFRGGRGRGRGSDRGRGGRGRGGGSRDTQHYDRQPYQQQGSDAQPQSANYGQQAYQPNQPNAYGLPPSYPSYQPFPQQPQQQPQQQHQQQQQFAQGAAPTAFNFQMPFQQAYPQQNPYQLPPNMQINPLFLAALQQQQQQQQYQQQQTPGQHSAQAATMNFDQVKAQLDLLRQLSNGNQGPPRS